MHGYHVIGDVLMTLLASALFMAAAVAVLGLSGKRTARRPRAPFRSRFRAWCYEVFGGRLEVPGDGHPLDEREQEIFNGYEIAEQRGGTSRSDAE